MSRPKPRVLLESINKKTYKAEQVLEAEAICYANDEVRIVQYSN